MLEDIERIGAFIGTLDRESFSRDDKTVFAVCYGFVRLGEAARHIPAEIVDAHPEIEWREIRHFRNFMIHVYLSVDPGRLYDTAKADLPGLAIRLERLLTA
jgi:uncharacterized protein with HEPN domain